MPTDQDYSMFRRYVGDFDNETIDEAVIDSYLDDATAEATAPHVSADTPIVTSYDSLNQKYAPEVVLLAAINWWWNKAANYADKLTTTVGQASEQATDRWNHAMQMIQSLQDLYSTIEILGRDPDVGNLSHWNRNTLSRVGGVSEEDAKARLIPSST